MGILDAFRKKKDDGFGGTGNDFGAPMPPGGDPNAGYPPMDQGQGFDPQGFNSDPMAGMSQDPYGGQGQDPYGSYPQQHQAPPPTPQNYPQQYDHVPSGQPAGYPPQAQYPQQQQPQQSAAEISMGKDLEIINAKLDAIKAELDSINQRVKRMEGGGSRGNWNY